MDDPGQDFTSLLDDDKLDAVVEAVYLAAYSDGDFSDVERRHFAHSVGLLTSGRVGGDRFEAVCDRAGAAVRSNGREACIQDIARRLDDETLRHVAFVLALDMVAADGRVLPEERRFLEEFAVALGLGEAIAGELLCDVPSP